VNVTLPIPDDLATRLSAGDSDLARQALEAFAADAYRTGRLTSPELRRLLGFTTRGELDGFLKARGIFHDYTVADLEQERSDFDRLATGASDTVARIHAFRRGKTLGGLDPAALIREGRR
jgi:hypothetical protein